MSFSTSEILWALVIVTGVLSTFGFFFVFSLVSNQKKVVTAQREKLAEAERARKALEEIPKYIWSGQEQERKRVAGELHDGVLQLLAGTRMKLEALILTEFDDDSPMKSPLTGISNTLNATVTEIQRIARNLRPKILDDFGLMPAIETLCRELERRCELSIQLQSIAIPRLASDTELAIYRIVQEALNNIEKHAMASQVMVEFGTVSGMFRALISDNGRGILPDRKEHLGSGMGLSIMEERARTLGGSMKMEGKWQQGTTITIEIPLNSANLPGKNVIGNLPG